ncbi:septal ring lytic transglycosylase RlpA family protein [Pedobacter sp. JY14-1]|uniref:septal ring lytic transglycosylase RlpA family protein n=1 Tax=Pedobacter sp. JY14-1 TaxID=3034151 RepID=UPI0023E15873|nr:septal ring lytic transglycosylase RlpA family protein [Pedobacter sp. JY14-1]
MKYCLLLSGMLFSSVAFAQNMPGNRDSNDTGTAIAAVADSTATDKSSAMVSETVYGTYYARRFEGRRTTSGARYRGKKLTAAHKTLPFGTVVTVTNPDNGRSVDVVINDRGPHSKKFSIDVSTAAAKALGFYGKGVAELEIAYTPEED